MSLWIFIPGIIDQTLAASAFVVINVHPELSLLLPDACRIQEQGEVMVIPQKRKASTYFLNIPP